MVWFPFQLSPDMILALLTAILIALTIAVWVVVAASYRED